MNDIIEWTMSKETIKKSQKGYAHFDQRTDMSKCASYISNPNKVATHGFYPFIHYEKNYKKFHKKNRKILKVRDICYAAHIDRCIYQLYSHIINELYNQRIKQIGIDSVPVAYRTDLKVSNIQLAKQAFDFIKNTSECYVMIGDFTGFFDNLDHNYLKKQWCDLLEVERLPKDHYAVFKNITKYSKFELNDILEINKIENDQSAWKKLNSMSRVLTKKQLNENRSKIIKNTNSFGIPQGSPISAILANLYMIEIDKKINDIVSNLNGLYMRYSDDFIIILPRLNSNDFKNIIGIIISIFNNTEGLQLQPHKTQYYIFSNNKILNCGNIIDASKNDMKDCIEFLGFSFNGTKITIRAKTSFKYYYRMYRKAKTIKLSRGYTPKGKKISTKNLYTKYSIRGAFSKQGNYLSYVERAKDCFGKDEEIDKSTKNHMQKIRQALK